MALGINHYSNAGLKVPNLGLNTPFFCFSAGYSNTERAVMPKLESAADIAESRTPSEIFRNTMVWSGRQNYPGYTFSRIHLVLAYQGLLSLRMGEKWRLEPGLDIIYNGANRFFFLEDEKNILETIQVGIYCGSSVQFYRSSIYFGLGVYVRDQLDIYSPIYNRIGYRFRFTQRFSGIFGIKANVGKAEYMEFGVGYSFLHKTNKRK